MDNTDIQMYSYTGFYFDITKDLLLGKISKFNIFFFIIENQIFSPWNQLQIIIRIVFDIETIDLGL